MVAKWGRYGVTKLEDVPNNGLIRGGRGARGYVKRCGDEEVEILRDELWTSGLLAI